MSRYTINANFNTHTHFIVINHYALPPNSSNPPIHTTLLYPHHLTSLQLHILALFGNSFQASHHFVPDISNVLKDAARIQVPPAVLQMFDNFYSGLGHNRTQIKPESSTSPKSLSLTDFYSIRDEMFEIPKCCLMCFSEPILLQNGS